MMTLSSQNWRIFASRIVRDDYKPGGFHARSFTAACRDRVRTYRVRCILPRLDCTYNAYAVSTCKTSQHGIYLVLPPDRPLGRLLRHCVRNRNRCRPLRWLPTVSLSVVIATASLAPRARMQLSSPAPTRSVPRRFFLFTTSSLPRARRAQKYFYEYPQLRRFR